MTTITEIKKNNKSVGFKVNGHANYGVHGHDIVCAAISCLTINTINSLKIIAEQEFENLIYNDDGIIIYTMKEPLNKPSEILLESARLGYKSIAEKYPENIIIDC